MTHLGCLQQIFGFHCCSSLQNVLKARTCNHAGHGHLPVRPVTSLSSPACPCSQLMLCRAAGTAALAPARCLSSPAIAPPELLKNQRWAQCTVNNFAYVNAGQQGQAACMPTRCQPCVFVFTQLTNESLARILQGSLVFTCCLNSLMTGSPTSLQSSRCRYGSAAPRSTPRL